MDKIHDKASKLYNDVRKKKIEIVKNIRKDKEHTKQGSYDIADLTRNCCLYCQKVFYGPKFLLKHLMRRHSNDLVLLHRNCFKQESNNNSTDLQCLMTFLESEFLTLKNELMHVKQTITEKNDDAEAYEESKSNEVQENVNICTSEEGSGDNIVTFKDSNEFNVLKEKMCDVEKNIQSLHNKFEELDNVLKNDVLLKQDVYEHVAVTEEKILKAQESQFIELRRILLSDMETTLINQLHKNNNEWKSQLLELRNEIKRLDWVTDTVKREINSSDFAKEMEKRLEQHIINFLGNTRHRSRKLENSRSRNKLSRVKTRSPLQERRKSKIKKSDTKTTEFSKCNNESSITCDELSFLVGEKLTQFSIGPSTSKLSNTEYDEKVKLVNTEKEHLMKKYPDFSEIYDNINMYADHRANTKLKSKKCRKIRFSEPLTTGIKTLSSSFTADDDCNLPFQNENYKQERLEKQSAVAKNQKKKLLTLESEGFDYSNIGASGDCSMNFSDNLKNSMKYTESSPIKEFKTSSPIREVHDKELNVTYLKDCSTINPVPSSSNQKLDYSSSEKHSILVYPPTKYPLLNQETSFYTTSKKNHELEDFKDKFEYDFDNTSLKSLSSLEDYDPEGDP